MWATNLKIISVVLGTLFVYTLICNKIPQMQSEVPQKLTLGADATPEQLAAAGEKVFNGVGGCTACHGLGTRAPNLLTDEKGTGTIGARCGKRESGKTCKQYLFESLHEPSEFVAPGYQPIMPVMTKIMPPEQIWALVAYLESQGGTVDVTASDFQSAAEPGEAAPAAGAAPVAFAGGSTDPKAIIKEADCGNCHKINGEGGEIGPDLSHVGGRRDATSIRHKILDPGGSVTKGFETMAGVMPKDFGTRMNAAQLEALVTFLASHK
jgi:mono/diheme cytochrome c family protein